MDSRSLRRALLAVAVGSSVVSGLARAQEVLPSPNYGVAPPVYVPATYPGGASMAPDRSSTNGVRAYMQQHGLRCAATVSSFGCGSWKADCTFAFGSCRNFWNEPCFPVNQSGYGAVAGTGRGSCGCR
jgi:hypothetical protein